MMDTNKANAERILIVDDISVNVEILREILSSQGYQAQCAQSVQEALDIMKDELPQLILSDYSMPGMNGLDFCKLLRSNPKTRDIPLIFITVADSSEEKRVAFEAGVVDFIRKPFEPIEVIMRVKNQINNYRMQLEMEKYNQRMHKMVTEQKRQLEKEQQNVLTALIKVLVRGDEHMEASLGRMGRNSHLLAQSMQLLPQYEAKVSNSFITTIGAAAQLHDIGNILIAEEEYFKEYDTEQERQEALLRLHTEKGAAMLEEISAAAGGNSPFLQMAIQICRYHHAKWDGSGYPRGMKGEDIPLAARITAVADGFNNFLGSQHSNTCHSVEQSVELINERSGTEYDPQIVNILNKVVKQMQVD